MTEGAGVTTVVSKAVGDVEDRLEDVVVVVVEFAGAGGSGAGAGGGAAGGAGSGHGANRVAVGTACVMS